jgi:hypothetical protein
MVGEYRTGLNARRRQKVCDPRSLQFFFSLWICVQLGGASRRSSVGSPRSATAEH